MCGKVCTWAVQVGVHVGRAGWRTGVRSYEVHCMIIIDSWRLQILYDFMTRAMFLRIYCQCAYYCLDHGAFGKYFKIYKSEISLLHLALRRIFCPT